MRNLLWIVLDSARWDAAITAATPNMDRIGQMERRWSYASWTAPSHLSFFMGLLPHRGQPGAAASIEYRQEFAKWPERLAMDDSGGFSCFAPSLSLPGFLARKGYRCEARVSMPVLNPATLLASGFDHYELLPAHNDIGAALDALHFDDRPVFHFINTGETHYPYLLPGETDDDLPLIPGVHGVWRTMDLFHSGGHAAEPPLDPKLLRPLWHKQVRCIENVDARLGEALTRIPRDTWVIVTSDHGELFGEDGWLGHGPVVHPKVLEVFLVEGLNPG
ncbi:metalloenzyme [Sphingomonas sp. UV9]|uniref:metalloenzyme n=1 Tax=Sphingomonas sp. UV9 TaxID=1851410 RepID=UPI000FFC216D|nr:metalloenzyme [Sphingomonas sp. UV9]RXD05717.1 metalloenzyme [Sphingomonas sp. UV9]